MRRSAMTPERLLTVTETAKLLNVSTKTIYRQIRAGNLPTVRVGNSHRISPEVLRRKIHEGRV